MVKNKQKKNSPVFVAFGIFFVICVAVFFVFHFINARRSIAITNKREAEIQAEQNSSTNLEVDTTNTEVTYNSDIDAIKELFASENDDDRIRAISKLNWYLNDHPSEEYSDLYQQYVSTFINNKCDEAEDCCTRNAYGAAENHLKKIIGDYKFTSSPDYERATQVYEAIWEGYYNYALEMYDEGELRVAHSYLVKAINNSTNQEVIDGANAKLYDVCFDIALSEEFDYALSTESSILITASPVMLFTNTHYISFTNIEISEPETASTGNKIDYTFEGAVIGYDFCSFCIKCYDKDGVYLDQVNFLSEPGDGQPFRESGTTYIPKDTHTIRVEVR